VSRSAPRPTPLSRPAIVGLLTLLGLLVVAGPASRSEPERAGALAVSPTPAPPPGRPLGAQALLGRSGEQDDAPVAFEAAVVGVALAPDGFRYALDRVPRDHPGLYLAGADRPHLFRARLLVTVDGVSARDRQVLVGYGGNPSGLRRGERVLVRGTALGRHADRGTPLVRAEAIEPTHPRPPWCAWRVIPGGGCDEPRQGPK
jgi:hypothetical protein